MQRQILCTYKKKSQPTMVLRKFCGMVTVKDFVKKSWGWGVSTLHLLLEFLKIKVNLNCFLNYNFHEIHMIFNQE
jgi:hypothetical protein